jgi:Skp family chaperone for outer membrane proteins
MKTTKLLAAMLVSAFVLPAFAQSTPNLDKREENQQQRIAQGVQSGQLTAKETQHLEARETKLASDEAAAKADGKVTRKERRKLQREADRDSAAIHRQKHDKQTR